MNPLMAVVDTVVVVEMVRHNLVRQRVYDPLKRPAVRPGVPDVDEHRILFPAAQIDKFLLIEETVSALQNPAFSTTTWVPASSHSCFTV